MVLVRLLLVVEGVPLFVDLALGEDTRLYVDLFLSLRVQIDFDCVVPFSGIVRLFLLVEIGCVVELVPDLRVQLNWGFDLLGPEYPLGHFRERFATLVGHEVVVHKLLNCLGLVLLVAPAFLVVVDLLVLLDHAVLLLVELAPQLLLPTLLLNYLHHFFVGSDVEIFSSFPERFAFYPDFFLLALLDCQYFGGYFGLGCSIVRLFVSELVVLLSALLAPCFDIALDLLQLVDALCGQRLIS